MRRTIRHLVWVLPLFLTMTSGAAQEHHSQTDTYNADWYMGAEGGVPFGFGSFSSFGHDRTRAGGITGLYAGYCFSPVLSAEIAAKSGQTTLAAHGCCVDAGYWFGADGIRYLAPVSGMDGWDYADLKSRVNLQQYGARLNVNLLGLFNGTKSGRWTLNVSPTAYAIGTKADIKTIAGNKKVTGNGSEWHFGYGGRLQAGYMATRNMHVGIYSEFTALSGNSIDGITEIRHDDNSIWESGIRIGWSFGRRGNKKAAKAYSESLPATSQTVVCSE